MSGLKGNHQNEQTSDRHSTLEVSRHTIRQALRELKTDGLILWRAGIGTIVRTQPEKICIVSGLNTLTDLLEFATETEMQILSKTPVVTDRKIENSSSAILVLSGSSSTSFESSRISPGL